MHKKRFEKLLKYCESKNLKVLYGNEDCCFPSLSLISINNSQNYKNRTYTLLHEIGHIEIYKNRNEWQKSFSIFSSDCTDGRVKRSKKYQVSLIAEEIDAWRIGMSIAEEVGIFIDKEEYINMMNSCVFTYISSASSEVLCD